MSVRAGIPPSAENLLVRAHLIGWLEDLERPVGRVPAVVQRGRGDPHVARLLVFFRSPEPNRSWVTAAGAVLDAAALHLSTVDVPREPQAALLHPGRASSRCGRRRLLRHRRRPRSRVRPTRSASPATSSTTLCDRMAAAGVPLVADRDQAWRDFAGWRVNYDRALLVASPGS